MHQDALTIDRDALIEKLRAAGKPVHVNRLSRTAVSAWLTANAPSRPYAPGSTYSTGETVTLNGRSAAITAIQTGHNPQQGPFQILTLTFADGRQKWMAAGINGAPTAPAHEITDLQIETILQQDGLHWRTAVQAELAQDERCVHVQTGQGDYWGLREQLPSITAAEIRQARQLVYEGYPGVVATETIVETLWALANDGSDEYHLFDFALTAALQSQPDLQYLLGAGWILSAQWRQLAERPSLVGPRIRNVVPPPAVDDDAEEETETGAAATTLPAAIATDVEAWRQQRRSAVTFTLLPSHYYYHWLPLRADLQQLFPPWPSRITFYHRFGGVEETFTAVINPHEGRVLGDRAMYDAFYQHGIYPGARLTITQRGSDYQYDIRTHPTPDQQAITVRRIGLDANSQLEYWEDEEPLRYAVDGDLFVASARWEDLPALFKQAEEAGQGIFGLMFKTCQKWRRERGAPLIVTAAELFAAVHSGERLTSKATIAYELWRRRAFKPLGQGRYQFHPEQGARTRSHGLTGQRSRRAGQRRAVQTPTTPLAVNGLTAADLWHALTADATRQETLEAAIAAYMAHPARAHILFVRETAHTCIRQLLAPERLEALTLDEFNSQVWQLGTVSYRGRRTRIDAAQVAEQLHTLTLPELATGVASGEIVLAGNQTWGSGAGVYGSRLTSLNDGQKRRLLVDTLRDLLYGRDPDVERIAAALQTRNGLGINSISGILHAVYPATHILYNHRSVEMVRALGIAWPPDWQRNAAVYLVYRDFMQRLRETFSFANLTDVDWFVYGWGNWQAGVGTPAAPEAQTDDATAVAPRPPKFERTTSGQLVAIDLLPAGPLFDPPPAAAEEARPASGYFIFQQKPASDYDDKTGRQFHWRQGTPGSRQVQPGARFIYYRPGEQVFFGTGRLEWIRPYTDPNGQPCCEGQITTYEAWKPPLPLTPALARQLNFVNDQWLGVGQAGIRKISRADFDAIVRAFRQRGEPAEASAAPPHPPPDPFLSEWSQLRDLIAGWPAERPIYTPGGRVNSILAVTADGLTVKTRRGESHVPWEWIRDVYKTLRDLGQITRADVQQGPHQSPGGYRSAFIFGLLAYLTHVEAQGPPAAQLLYRAPTAPLALRDRSPFAPDQSTPPPTNPPPVGPPPPASPSPAASRSSTGEEMPKTSKSLFAQHYLQHRLLEHPEWQEDATAVLAQFQALYAAQKDLLPQYNEAQTEQAFIQPALTLLGFAFTVQTSAGRAGQTQRPDYALFLDAVQKRSADNYIREETPFYGRAAAICEAKYWERPLTVQHADSGRAQYDNRNPSFQIVNYLTGTGVDWGILTNGRLWRLYYRQASSTATEFYEVDLVDLLAAADPDQFMRFWLFFRRDAFKADAHGRNFLERVRDGSTTYARAVSDALKGRVFDEIFPLLAGGFVADMARQGQDPTTDEARALIYEATLSLLYKLLFLLYAEARDLLPLDNPAYRRESITQLAQEVAGRLDRAETLGETAVAYYRRLLALFEVIDRGDRGLGLPRYNGGLFHFDFSASADPAAQSKHRANYFLTRYAVNDARLAQALDRLARVNGEFVDYSFLEVRHLGAVYEGLLEYRLVIEDASAGRVRLATDKGERKATGSYYTPDYIVKYIVHHTLEPILEARAQRFGELMVTIAPRRSRLAELERKLGGPAGSLSAGVQTRFKHEAHVLRQELARLEKEARDALLDVKVCDPAMGSGHFLVEAVDFLTDRLIEILNQYPDHNPVLRQLDDVRRAILNNMAAQGVAIDAARLDDTQLLQRAVMKRCIYGVDLNRMAVELAKVSLWLHSFTIGAPLSFLDHHLRWGNSLIGANARAAEQALAVGSGQLSLFGGPFKGLLRAAEVMRGISSLSDATLAEVAQSEALFRDFDAAARPYKQLLDLHVAQHFGVKRAAEFLTLYGADAIKAGAESVGPLYAQTLNETQQLFEKKRFFHWELEFPEVFIDLDLADWKTNPGFDVVLGNPPYDELSEFALEREIDEKTYIKSSKLYEEAATYRINLYRLFVANAIDKTKLEGTHGFIVPMSLLGDRFTYELRHKILQENSFLLIEAFPQKDDPRNRVFFDAKLPSCLYVLQKKLPGEIFFRVRTHPGKHILEDSPSYVTTSQEIFSFDPENSVIPIVGEKEWKLAKKLAFQSSLCSIGEIAKPMSGEVVFNKTFKPYMSHNPEHTLILRGGHVQRYELIDNPKQGTPEYIDKEKWLKNSQEGSAAFAHEKSRVVYQEGAALDNWRRIIATYLPAGYVCGHKICYFVDVQYDDFAFLALFNSSVVEWRFRLVSMTNSLAAYQISSIPVPRFDFSVLEPNREELVRQGIELFSKGSFSALLAFVDSLISKGSAGLIVVHDLLSLLAQNIIQANEKKQVEIKGFLY